MQFARELGWLDPMPANELSPRKVAFFKDLNCWRALLDCALMCAFVPWSAQQFNEMVSATTGWNTTVYECLKVGERAVTMARVFNVREGLTRADDMLPDRFFSPPKLGALAKAGQAMDREQLERAKSYYYSLMGWDAGTGVPTAEKLESLDLGHLVGALPGRR